MPHTDCNNSCKEIKVPSPINVKQPLFVALIYHYGFLIIVEYGRVDVFLLNGFCLLIADTLKTFFISGLRPVKLISLILSQVSRKVGRKLYCAQRMVCLNVV